MKKSILKIAASTALVMGASACSKNSFTLSKASEGFRQEATINNKVDIVWVVDSSLTMANHQVNLGTNFSAFIDQFKDRGFDFRMVVASTDGWVRETNYNGGSCVSDPNPSGNPLTPYVSSADCKATHTNYGELSMFRDGDIYGIPNGSPGARSGNYMITSAMNQTTLVNTFKTNIKTGTRGDGSRESAFQSLRAVLRRNSDGSIAYGGETHTSLASFRRDDAFLAVIVVSDEDDQSVKQDGAPYADIADYTQSFVSFLDGYTGGIAGNRKYSVSGIVLEDINNCTYGLHPQAVQGDKYVSVVNATRGTVGNICSNNFSSALNNISEKIITLATRFRLNRKPDPESIQISVNGQSVANDEVNGWTYFSENGYHYIEFHGTSIPPEDAMISVDFDPVDLI